MATTTSWKELGTLLAEAQLRQADAATLDAYRWDLLEASARLSTARLAINRPTPVLDQTDAGLLEPLEAASPDAIARFLADVAAAPAR